MLFLVDREVRKKKWGYKFDEGIFLGNSKNSCAYHLYNECTRCLMESINVVANDATNLSVFSIDEKENGVLPLVGEVVPNKMADMSSNLTPENSVANGEIDEIDPKEVEICERQPLSKVRKNHPSNNITGKLEEGVSTRKKGKVNYMEMTSNICFTSSVEPKNIKEALKDDCWINAM